MVTRRRPPYIPVRTPIFVGCEGDTEIAVAGWLQLLCEENGCSVTLRRFNAAGGDTFSVVETSRDRRRNLRGQFVRSIVLLDNDRLKQDGERGRAAVQLARKEGLDLIFSNPSIEALLVRLVLVD